MLLRTCDVYGQNNVDNLTDPYLDLPQTAATNLKGQESFKMPLYAVAFCSSMTMLICTKQAPWLHGLPRWVYKFTRGLHRALASTVLNTLSMNWNSNSPLTSLETSHTSTFEDVWAKIPVATLHNLVECLSKRVVAVIGAKRSANPY